MFNTKDHKVEDKVYIMSDSGVFGVDITPAIVKRVNRKTYTLQLKNRPKLIKINKNEVWARDWDEYWENN